MRSGRIDMKCRQLLMILMLAAITVVCRTMVLAEESTIHRESIEWTQLWIPEATKTDLPRVLLIGDSICNAYYDVVAEQLKGKAHVAKFATSSAVGDPALTEQIKMLLSNYKFAVVHFNVGLHGFGYSEAEYRQESKKLVELMRKLAPQAKFIWATSTPLRNSAKLDEFQDGNERVKERNRIVRELAAAAKIPIDDLYPLVENHPEYWSNDGVHFKAEGKDVQAKQVARTVLEELPK
jgi:lysophospholipase L1-like esterase